MLDINNELDCILKKYGIYKKDLLRTRLETAICQIVSESIKKYGKRIVVRGLKYSENGYPLLKLLSEYGNIIAVVDKKPFADTVCVDKQMELNILDLEHATDIECDVYIINSKYQGKNIYYDVISSKQNKCVIDLYTEMRVRYGILGPKLFEEYEEEIDLSSNKIRDAYILFERERNIENLESLLGKCLINRDFITFNEVLDGATDLIEGNERIYTLREEIDGLLKEIKKCIAERRKKQKQDIIMHWIDQVGHDELEMFPKLSNLMEKGICFENAYAVTPYTVATELCLFYKDIPTLLDRNAINKLMEGGINSSFLYKTVTDKGYSFVLTGGMAADWPHSKNEYTEFMVASSVYYWNMLNSIINSEKPVFGIVGCLAETHEPWMAPKCSENNPSFEFYGSYQLSKSKVATAAQFYDEIINFYTDMLGVHTVNIYMSDHGKWEDINLRRYDDFAMHTILAVTNIGITGKVVRLFSYRYFLQLIDYILFCADGETQQHVFGDTELRSVGFQKVVQSRVKEVTESDEQMKELQSDICSGYQGIKTDYDTYIKLGNGKEIYFLNEDKKQTNQIKELRYRSRIEMLREKVE